MLCTHAWQLLAYDHWSLSDACLCLLARFGYFPAYTLGPASNKLNMPLLRCHVFAGNAKFYAENGVSFVMGTTGGDPAVVAAAAEAAGVYAVVSPQMGKQVMLVTTLASPVLEHAATGTQMSEWFWHLHASRLSRGLGSISPLTQAVTSSWCSALLTAGGSFPADDGDHGREFPRCLQRLQAGCN